ncbi:hypothetical protein [Sodalis ligni]|nr:hypothetical protein [Sodalis ligni]
MSPVEVGPVGMVGKVILPDLLALMVIMPVMEGREQAHLLAAAVVVREQ